MPASHLPPTIADAVRDHARNRGGALAYEFEGRHTTFADFDANASRVANALIATGIKKGDRIAFVGKNSDIYFELLIGATKVGAVVTPVNWRLAPPEVAFVVEDCKAPLLFVGPEFIDLVRGIRGSLPTVRDIITMEGGAPEWTDFAAWRDAQPADDPRLPIGSDDVAIQLYTSGTTGKPKGAMLSHANLVNMMQVGDGTAIPDWGKWDENDVSLVAMPGFHIGGTGWALTALYYGARGVVTREFDATKVLGHLSSGITKLFMVPAAMQFVVRQPGAHEADFSRLRYICYGASPIPAALLKECIDVFKCGFVQMYGMTETTGTIVALAPEDHVVGSERMRAAGRALSGVELAVLGVDGEPLPPGEIGEIATRSASNMVGYWNLPEATAKTVGKNGWLLTGDAGYLDEDGYLFIHDRIKDMIISGGENVYPAEVESAVCDHPDVAEAAVIGVPDDKWGESVKAIVVLKPGKTATAADIINFTRERIAGYKTPKTVEFLAALPRNPSGKILRRELRAPFWEGKDRQVN